LKRVKQNAKIKQNDMLTLLETFEPKDLTRMQILDFICGKLWFMDEIEDRSRIDKIIQRLNAMVDAAPNPKLETDASYYQTYRLQRR